MFCSSILSGYIDLKFQNTHYKDQLTRLTWYHQNLCCVDGHHTYVTSENYKNNIEGKEVRHTSTTQEARGLKYRQISISIQQDFSLKFVI